MSYDVHARQHSSAHRLDANIVKPVGVCFTRFHCAGRTFSSLRCARTKFRISAASRPRNNRRMVQEWRHEVTMFKQTPAWIHQQNSSYLLRARKLLRLFAWHRLLPLHQPACHRLWSITSRSLATLVGSLLGAWWWGIVVSGPGPFLRGQRVLVTYW